MGGGAWSNFRFFERRREDKMFRTELQKPYPTLIQRLCISVIKGIQLYFVRLYSSIIVCAS